MTNTTRTLALAALLAVGISATTLAAPAPAKADTASTVSIAAAAALIVGSLILDSNTNQYYYMRDNRRCYVNYDTAAYWYQRNRPAYYDAHRNRFAARSNARPTNWNSSWNGNSGYRDRGNDGNRGNQNGHGNYGSGNYNRANHGGHGGRGGHGHH